jgi:hypothetical protein
MRYTRKGHNYFFVDESGDTTFYNKKGFPIVGVGGCSPILLLGFIETRHPVELRQEIITLHNEILADPYFQAKPSFKKTEIAFHAKDDCPEVRELVFELIEKQRFSAEIVVSRKNEQNFRQAFGANENRYYDYLIGLLFRTVLHRYEENTIYFSQRGSRLRQKPLNHAIQSAKSWFQQKHQRSFRSTFEVLPQSPKGEPCLSIIDYINWAIHRAYVYQEMQYYERIADRVSLVLDYADYGCSGKNVYNKKNPFHIEKATPLVLGSK